MNARVSCMALVTDPSKGAVPLNGDREEGTKDYSNDSTLLPTGQTGRYLGVQNIGGFDRRAASSLAKELSKDKLSCPVWPVARLVKRESIKHLRSSLIAPDVFISLSCTNVIPPHLYATHEHGPVSDFVKI